MLAFIAQLTAENPALYTYGPLGVFCAFFMWRDVNRQQAHERERAIFISEVRAVRHSMDGLQRAFLVHTMEVATFPTTIRDYARAQIAKIDARMATNSAEAQ